MNLVRRSNNSVTIALKSLSTLAFVFFGITSAMAQPTVLGTHLVNGSYTTYDLNTVGGFKQYRLQATSSASSGARSWEFATGTASSTNYSTNWRPYTGGQTLSTNTYIPTSFNNGAKYNTSSGGSSGLLPAITSGNYYTFNVSNNSSADNTMQLLETSFSPATISTVSATTPSNDKNSVLVTITTSSAPSSGEYVYVRYSTNSYSTSTIAQFYFSGTTGTAIIPRQTGGTSVSYYIYSLSLIHI